MTWHNLNDAQPSPGQAVLVHLGPDGMEVVHYPDDASTYWGTGRRLLLLSAYPMWTELPPEPPDLRQRVDTRMGCCQTEFGDQVIGINTSRIMENMAPAAQDAFRQLCELALKLARGATPTQNT